MLLLGTLVTLVNAARPKDYSADLETYDADVHDSSIVNDVGSEAAEKASHNASSRSYLQMASHSRSSDPKPLDLQKCLDVAVQIASEIVYEEPSDDPRNPGMIARLPAWYEKSWFRGETYEGIKRMIAPLFEPQYVRVPGSKKPQYNAWRSFYKSMRRVKDEADMLQSNIAQLIDGLAMPEGVEDTSGWVPMGATGVDGGVGTKDIAKRIIKQHIVVRTAKKTMVHYLSVAHRTAQMAVEQAYGSPDLAPKFASIPLPLLKELAGPTAVPGTYAQGETPRTLFNKVLYACRYMRVQWLKDLVEYCTPDDDVYKSEDDIMGDEYPYEEDIKEALRELQRGARQVNLPSGMKRDWPLHVV